MYCCNSAYSSSSKYIGQIRSNVDDSMKVNTGRQYTPMAYEEQNLFQLLLGAATSSFRCARLARPQFARLE